MATLHRGRKIDTKKSMATKRYPSGRACAEEGCPTILSVYNREIRCWDHQTPDRYGLPRRI